MVHRKTSTILITVENVQLCPERARPQRLQRFRRISGGDPATQPPLSKEKDPLSIRQETKSGYKMGMFLTHKELVLQSVSRRPNCSDYRNLARKMGPWSLFCRVASGRFHSWFARGADSRGSLQDM